jgi:uncharacterized protein (TIGR00369 family)
MLKEPMMQKQPNSRMCFLCGLQNPIGLKLAFYDDVEKQKVHCTFTVPDEYQGYPGIVHGGIIAAILDETAGRVTLLNGHHENLFATMRLTVRYRHPTPTETALTAIGWIEKEGQIAKVAGEIRLPDGTVTADCEALITSIPDEFRARWESERPYWKVYPDD